MSIRTHQWLRRWLLLGVVVVACGDDGETGVILPTTTERHPVDLSEAYFYPLVLPTKDETAQRGRDLAAKLVLPAAGLAPDGAGRLVVKSAEASLSLERYGRIIYDRPDTDPGSIDIVGEAADRAVREAARKAGQWIFALGLVDAETSSRCFGSDGQVWDAQWAESPFSAAAPACATMQPFVAFDFTETGVPQGFIIRFERFIPIGKDAAGTTHTAPIRGATIDVKLSAKGNPTYLNALPITIDVGHSVVDRKPRDIAQVLTRFADVTSDQHFSAGSGSVFERKSAVLAYDVTDPDLSHAGGRFEDSRLTRPTLIPGYVFIGDQPTAFAPARFLPLDSLRPSFTRFELPAVQEPGTSSTWSFELEQRDAGVARWYREASDGELELLGEGSSIKTTLADGDHHIRLDVRTPEISPNVFRMPDGSTSDRPLTLYSFGLITQRPAPPLPTTRNLEPAPASVLPDFPKDIPLTDVAGDGSKNYLVTYSGGKNEGAIKASATLAKPRYSAKAGTVMVGSFGIRYWQYEIEFASTFDSNGKPWDGRTFTGKISSDYCGFSAAEVGDTRGACFGHTNGATLPFVTYNPENTEATATKDSYSTLRQFHNLPGNLKMTLNLKIPKKISGGPSIPAADLMKLAFEFLMGDAQLGAKDVKEFKARFDLFGKDRPGIEANAVWSFDDQGLICLNDFAEYCKSRDAEQNKNTQLYPSHKPNPICEGEALAAYKRLIGPGGIPVGTPPKENKVPVLITSVRVRTFTELVPLPNTDGVLPVLINETGAPATLIGDGTRGPNVMPVFNPFDAFHMYYAMKNAREVKSVTRRPYRSINGDFHNVHFKKPGAPTLPMPVVVPGCANTFPVWTPQLGADGKPIYKERRIGGAAGEVVYELQKNYFMDTSPECVHYHSKWHEEAPFDTSEDQLDQMWVVGAPGGAGFPMMAAANSGVICTENPARAGEISGTTTSYYDCKKTVLWNMTEAYTYLKAVQITQSTTPVFLTQ